MKEPFPIPSELWRTATVELADAVKTASKKKKKKKERVTWIRQFIYSLQNEKFVDCSIQQSSNLYFEFAVATKEDVSRDYIVIQLNDNDEEEQAYSSLRNGTKNNNNTRGHYSYQVDPLREAILRNGICGFQREEDQHSDKGTLVYNLIGCSNSQVQRHCYIFRISPSIQDNEKHLLRLLPSLRELEEKKGVPKRVKYAGLVFSGITPVTIPESVVVEEIESKQSNGYDFTDGPGLISLKLAKLVQKELGMQGHLPPSIFQIRYCGKVSRLNSNEQHGFVCKGVLVVDPTDDESYKIQVRASMLKVASSDLACEKLRTTLGICDYSQSSSGRLGQQLICLLSDVVNKEDFLGIQKEYLSNIGAAMRDPFSMAWALALDRQRKPWSALKKLLLESGEKDPTKNRSSIPVVYHTCADAVQNNRLWPSSSKVQIPLAASRNLFGGVFPELLHDCLNEGECIILLEDGPLVPNSVHNGVSNDTSVIVSRSPSYHPGDVRVLRVVTLPAGHPVLSLRNCILFSTKGDRPDPDKMGGGDLDGDKYLVIWHPTLLKYAKKLKSIHPESYDVVEPSEETAAAPSGKIDWVNYAAMTDNAMLGEVESTFYKLAAQHGVSSHKVAHLNRLFSSLVDRNPTSVDEFSKLKNSVSGILVDGRDSTWGEMILLQTEAIEGRRKARQRKDLKGSSYQEFKRAVAREALCPSKLKDTILFDFDHHFLQSPWHKDVKGVSEAWEKHCIKVGGAEFAFSHTDLLEPTDENKNSALTSTQVTAEEVNNFSRRKDKAYRLFEGPLLEHETQRKEPECSVKEQKARREAICLERTEALSAFENQIARINDKKGQTEETLRRIQDEHRQDLLRKIQEHQKRKLPLEDEANRLQKKVHAKMSELCSVQTQLNGFFGAQRLFSFVFQNPRNLTDMEGALLAEVGGLKEKVDAARSRLENEEVNFNQQTRECNILYLQKIDEEKSRLRYYQGELEGVEADLIACRQKYDKLLRGPGQDVITRCERQMKHLEDELNSLRGELAIIEGKTSEVHRLLQHQCGKSWQHSSTEELVQSREELDSQHTAVRDKINAYLNNLHDLEAESRRYFCPEVLVEAEELLLEIDDKMESLLLGRGHILRVLDGKEQEWRDLVHSGMLSTAGERRTRWREVLRHVDSVYVREENRLLGMPRKGQRDGPLPVYHKRAELRRLMSSNQALIVTAGTGCGKSTQLPQYIADDYRLYCNGFDADSYAQRGNRQIRICCTQPRRVAAQKVATRVAEEYKTTLGGLVGYKVGRRGRSKEEASTVSEDTMIEFVTEGLLLFNLARSKDFINSYDCIIIDEMHERNTEQDLCVSLLRDYLRSVEVSRPSFKVVVMSATIDPSIFCRYFDNCPTMDCPGRNFPVQENYRPSRESSGQEETVPSHTVTHAVEVLFDDIVYGGNSEIQGDVLIFLSGSKDIFDCVNEIQVRAEEGGILVAAYPLHSKLEQDTIRAATNPEHRQGLDGEFRQSQKSGAYIRKVICCTNIAETSLTLDRVRFVIDSGKARKAVYDHSYRCQGLNEDWVSKASVKQRKGRAGRTQSGWCYYLYSEEFHRDEMLEYERPKIMEESVDKLILFSLHVCNRSIENMGLLDSPSEEDICNAKERLIDLDLIKKKDKHGTNGDVVLTKHGRIACDLPSLRPESIRMLLHACEKYPHCIQRAIKLAVLMSSDESVISKRMKSCAEEGMDIHVYGDHLLELQHFDWFETSYATPSNKKANIRSLKQKCEERGLDFSLLQNMQEDVERYHQEIKKRKLLVSCNASSDDANTRTTLGEDQCLLRILISGYYHHIVECIDPQFLQKDGCFLLTQNGLRFFLDRKSCLQGLLVDSQEEVLNDEETKTEADSDFIETYAQQKSITMKIQEEAVRASFFLHGRLFLFRSSEGFQKVFMQDVSAIEGSWIVEEAPRRWQERVVFDPEKESLCRVTIKNVGPSILSLCQKERRKSSDGDDLSFFDFVEEMSGVYALSANLRGANVRIAGEQSAVENAKSEIQQALSSIIKQRCDADKAHNGESGLRFSTGMKIEGRFRQHSPLHEYFRADGVTMDNFDNESLLYIRRGSFQGNGSAVVGAICHEAMKKSPYWQNFCARLPTKGKGRTGVRFSVSHDSFEVFGPNQQELATALRQSIASLASSMAHHLITTDDTFPQYQIRRLAALLEEIRKDCPDGLFYVQVAETADQKNVEKFSFDFISEYSWLVAMSKAHKIRSIKISFAAFNKKEWKRIKDMLTKRLPKDALRDTEEAIEAGKQQNYEKKKCVSCRRVARIELRKKNDKKESSGLGKDLTVGWNLTLCGCAYCRECFRLGVTECLSDSAFRSARCLNCTKPVLAQDCWNIFSGLPKEQYHHCAPEWSHLCQIAEARYCEDNLTFLTRRMRAHRWGSQREPGWISCPDCRVAQVYSGEYTFFCCRNEACRSMFCSRCCRVVTSERDFKRCDADRCKPWQAGNQA